jgi:hypothetical protein
MKRLWEGCASIYVRGLAVISEKKKEFSEGSGGISSETVNRLKSYPCNRL